LNQWFIGIFTLAQVIYDDRCFAANEEVVPVRVEHE